MAALSVTVQVRGLKEVDRMLAQLPPEVAGPIMKDALRASGQIILGAAQRNIHSRTGRTAADLVATVQVDPERQQGVVAVGGTVRGSTGRAHVIRWLEFGTKPHAVVAGTRGRREIRRAVKALTRLGQAPTAVALLKGIRAGRISGAKRALTLPGGILRASAGKKNPISAKPQAPLTRALFTTSRASVGAFKDVLWREIVKFVQSVPKVA